ncbi:hypothetical protein RUM43_012498 [Polyplax serrata]|uniref:Tetratricopeptide repeat protein 17 n=1 Tax=Polyplax serrata TaxID=468196 RepID=A0AAN8RT08_POLSC
MVGNRIRIFTIANCFLGIYASYHWVVTESGRIQPQVENSGFPLTRKDNLLLLLEQDQRLTAINRLYKELLTLKKSIGTQWAKIEGEGDLEKRLYATDIDCLLGGIPLSQHNLNTEFLDYNQGSRPKMKDNSKRVEPDCTVYSDLDFSMRTFPHLDTLNKRDNFNLFINPVPSKTIFDFNIDEMLRQNNSDWTAYNIASHYWRTVGNGTHAVECARRALYFSPMSERYLVLLNLGTLLQELQRLGEAAIVLHSAVDHDPVQYITHLALGNVYAALGDYSRSLACYDNVLSLSPGNVRALQLKHALLCRKKLESGLLEIHLSLQGILQDLQKHNTMHEEWLLLQNQVNWERDSKVKEFFSLSQPLYLNLKMLLQNVEQQAKNLNEEVSKRVPKKKPRLRAEEKNQIKLESIFDCSSEECPTYMRQQNKNLNSEVEDETVAAEYTKETIKDLNKAGIGRGSLETSEEHSLRTKMNSLMNMIKSRYEEEVKMVDFKRRGTDELDLKKSEYSNNEDGHFRSIDRTSFLMRNIDACVKDPAHVKKLN